MAQTALTRPRTACA